MDASSPPIERVVNDLDGEGEEEEENVIEGVEGGEEQEVDELAQVADPAASAVTPVPASIQSGGSSQHPRSRAGRQTVYVTPAGRSDEPWKVTGDKRCRRCKNANEEFCEKRDVQRNCLKCARAHRSCEWENGTVTLLTQQPRTLIRRRESLTDTFPLLPSQIAPPPSKRPRISRRTSLQNGVRKGSPESEDGGRKSTKAQLFSTQPRASSSSLKAPAPRTRGPPLVMGPPPTGRAPVLEHTKRTLSHLITQLPDWIAASASFGGVEYEHIPRDMAQTLALAVQSLDGVERELTQN